MKRYGMWCACLAMLVSAMAVDASAFPRRFAIESASTNNFAEVALIGDGLSAVQSLQFINWGSIQPNAPVDGVNEYAPFPSNSWWAAFLDQLEAADRGLLVTLELGATPWAIERDPDILVRNPTTGELENGLVRIFPEYTETWQDFIKHLLTMTPQITHLQIDSEPDNVWVHAPGYIEALRLAYAAVQAFNSEHPGRNVEVLAAGFNLAGLIQVPESFIQDIVADYPATADMQSLKEAFPHVDDDVLRLWSQKLHLVVGVLSQEDPADPSFDILSVHHDRGRTFDSAPALVAWYRNRMATGVHGAYDRPIWVDDMSSNYHTSSGGTVSDDDLALLAGLEEGDAEVIAAYNAQQPVWLVKKAVGNFAAGIARVSIAYGHDIPDYFLPIWRYMGLFYTNNVAQPSYYTTRLLVEKLDGFISATRLHQADTNNYLYHFTFSAKPDVFVAWRETDGIMDLSAYATGTTLGATYLVMETTAQGNAIWPPQDEFPADAVPVTPEPVFLEATDSLPPRVPIYRFWSPVNGSHFFTMSSGERDQIIATWPDVWTYEGIAWYAYASDVPGAAAVYRFWSPVYRKHFYTISTAERDQIITTWPDVWTYEGEAWYARPVASFDTAPVHRFWSPVYQGHFFTISAAERDNILASWPDIWSYEGIAYHAYASASATAVASQSTLFAAAGEAPVAAGAVQDEAGPDAAGAPRRTAMATSGEEARADGAIEADGQARGVGSEVTRATANGDGPLTTWLPAGDVADAQDGVWLPVMLDGFQVAALLYDPLEADWDYVVPATASPEALFVPIREVGRRYWLAILIRDPETDAWTFVHGSWLGRMPDAPSREPERRVDETPDWMGMPVAQVLLPTGEGLLEVRIFCPDEGRTIQTVTELEGGVAHPVAIPRWNAWYRLDVVRARDGAVLQALWVGHVRTH